MFSEPGANRRINWSVRNDPIETSASKFGRAPIMSAGAISELFIYVGAIGVLQFVSLAFAARQLQGVAMAQVRRRMSSPVTRHAYPLASLSAVLLVVGIVLRMHGTA